MNPNYEFDKWARPRYEACQHKPLVRTDGTTAICEECRRPICGAGCGLCIEPSDMHAAASARKRQPAGQR